MDGFETTQHIRELETDRRTPIIALTAHSLTEQKSELLIAGMDDCVSKPVNEAQLAHIINRWACLSGKTEVVAHQDTSSVPEKKLPAEKHADIDGSVDIELCLKLANKKPALARDMLKMMVEGLQKEKNSINAAAANNDIHTLGELIHRLYGSSCYCGVPRLKSITGLLDKLIQAKEIDEVEKAIPTLNHAIDDILRWSENKDIDKEFGLSV
ncbi:MAG: response regulator, partial [Moraxellaceae bacterium]